MSSYAKVRCTFCTFFMPLNSQQLVTVITPPREDGHDEKHYICLKCHQKILKLFPMLAREEVFVVPDDAKRIVEI